MRANKIHNNTAAAADNASDDDDDVGEMSSLMKSEISEDTSVTQSFINDTSLTGTDSVSLYTGLCSLDVLHWKCHSFS